MTDKDALASRLSDTRRICDSIRGDVQPDAITAALVDADWGVEPGRSYLCVDEFTPRRLYPASAGPSPALVRLLHSHEPGGPEAESTGADCDGANPLVFGPEK